MRRRDKEITSEDAINDILASGTVCHLALHDTPFPYVVPLNYGVGHLGDQQALFFHGAAKGRKIDLIRRDPRASFVVDIDHKLIVGDEACRFTMHYASVMGVGEVTIMEDLAEKRYGLERIMAQYTGHAQWELPERALSAMSVFALILSEVSAKRSPPQQE